MMNETILINGQQVPYQPGETILNLAQRLGILIPTLCYRSDIPHPPSCMVCVVWDQTTARMLPACATQVRSGMNIQTDSDEIHQIRETTLKMILSEHRGQCEAPCATACPLNLNIPEVHRLLMEGKREFAEQKIQMTIPFPSIVGRLCPAPCEKACLRRHVDSSLAIRTIEKILGDNSYRSPFLFPKIRPDYPSVGIVGGGPAGITLSWYLRHAGFPITLYEAQGSLGGSLDKAPLNDLPEPLHCILSRYLAPDVQLFLNRPVDNMEKWDQLRQQYPIFILLPGIYFNQWVPETIGSYLQPGQITSSPYFDWAWIPSGVKHSIIRTIGTMARLAREILQRFVPQHIDSDLYPVIQTLYDPLFYPPRVRILASELKNCLDKWVVYPHHQTYSHPCKLSLSTLTEEAQTCLRCRCIAEKRCALRRLRLASLGSSWVVHNPPPDPLHRVWLTDEVFLDHDRCIRCGICVQICRNTGVHKGLTFIKRGFHMQIGTPWNQPFPSSASSVLEQCIRLCPTQAIVRKEK